MAEPSGANREMGERWSAAVSAAALLFANACSGSAPPSTECIAPAGSLLYGGQASADAFELAPDQTLAIGALEDDAGTLVCTGTLVAERFVLTARHCEWPSQLWFRLQTPSQAVRAGVVRAFPHPERDVKLLELGRDARVASLGVPSIALMEAPLGAEWIGRVVTLAGFGRTEIGTHGVRSFVKEPIVDVSADFLFVEGGGATGACNGDSGGPLLGLVEGRARLLGILRSGSPSCTGRDRYERGDTLRSWLSVTLMGAASDPCGMLTEVGACLGEGPIWCSGGSLVTEACTGKEVCDYSVEARAYRCVDNEARSCAEVQRASECAADPEGAGCE